MEETKNEALVTAEREEVEAGTQVVPAGKMEFRLISPTESGFIKKIVWNKEELEAAVKAKVSTYENVVYTEENIKQAKNDRAELNKLVEAIEERRKKVKEIVNKPYADFEAELKDVVQLIREPVALIDEQIKNFENQQKEEKKQKIIAAYNESIGEYADALPFDKVFDKRYLNATYSLAKAIQEVKEKIEKVSRDLQTIDGLDSKFKLNVRDVYIQTLDLSKAMAEDRRLKDMEERLEAERRAKEEAEAARIAKAEQERAAKAAAMTMISARPAENKKEQNETENAQTDNDKALSDNENAQNETETPQNETEAHPAPAEDTKIYKASFWCKGTKQQISGVLEYMRNNGISYGRVDK